MKNPFKIEGEENWLGFYNVKIGWGWWTVLLISMTLAILSGCKSYDGPEVICDRMRNSVCADCKAYRYSVCDTSGNWLYYFFTDENLKTGQILDE